MDMAELSERETKEMVRKGYAKIAKREQLSCCGPSVDCAPGAAVNERTSSGVTGAAGDPSQTVAKAIGYSDEDLAAVPEGANLGLGCGNPTALASLKEGETVLDLGSGGGFDCFLAADKVGATGRVIGVDMTPEMIDKARENAHKDGRGNIEFRLGEIEHLPAGDGTVDAVISNCVINLSPDKPAAFREAFRVLKDGGRMMISDMVLTKELPDKVRSSVSGYLGCVSGAMFRQDYLKAIEDAGFGEVSVLDEKAVPVDLWIASGDPTVQSIIEEIGLTEEDLAGFAGSAVSVTVQGLKS